MRGRLNVYFYSDILWCVTSLVVAAAAPMKGPESRAGRVLYTLHTVIFRLVHKYIYIYDLSSERGDYHIDRQICTINYYAVCVRHESTGYRTTPPIQQQRRNTASGSRQWKLSFSTTPRRSVTTSSLYHTWYTIYHQQQRAGIVCCFCEPG